MIIMINNTFFQQAVPENRKDRKGCPLSQYSTMTKYIDKYQNRGIRLLKFNNITPNQYLELYHNFQSRGIGINSKYSRYINYSLHLIPNSYFKKEQCLIKAFKILYPQTWRSRILTQPYSLGFEYIANSYNSGPLMFPQSPEESYVQACHLAQGLLTT